MSQENVETVQSLYEAHNALGGIGPESTMDPENVAPGFWSRLARDVELHDRADLPDPRVCRGREEVKGFWRKTRELFAEARWEPLEFIDLGHAVVANVRVVAIGRSSGARTQLNETDVFWFREGLIVRMQGFASKQEALEAAGLRE
jgi:ketosteroid isomerase-like protein